MAGLGAARPPTIGAPPNERLRYGHDRNDSNPHRTRTGSRSRPRAHGRRGRREASRRLQRRTRLRAVRCRPAGLDRGTRDRDEALPRRRARRGRAGRHDGACRRRDTASGRDRDLDGTHGGHRGDRLRFHDGHRARRDAPADTAGSRGRGRLPVSARPRRARFVHDRRQHRDERRRQPGHPLRHDAQSRAGARSRARRRHGRELHEPDAQEQRRLRSQATFHRHRRHARHRYASRAQALAATAEQDRRALRARRFPRGGGPAAGPAVAARRIAERV